MKLSTLLINQLDMVALAAYNAGQYKAHAAAAMIDARDATGPNVRAHCVKTARWNHSQYVRQIRHVREILAIEGRLAATVSP